jgi:hypothetical protein
VKLRSYKFNTITKRGFEWLCKRIAEFMVYSFRNFPAYTLFLCVSQQTCEEYPHLQMRKWRIKRSKVAWIHLVEDRARI